MGLGRYNVGGCCGCPPPGPVLLCGCLPPTNLTLTTTNSLFGVRTSTLVFDGVSQWATTACESLTIFRLSCDVALGTIIFRATRYPGGPCFGGSSVICSSASLSPSRLTPTTSSCSPLLREYTTASCSALSSVGYTKLAITL